MQAKEIARSFQSKTNEELLRIALHIGQLSPETTHILRAELARRRLNDPERVNSYRVQQLSRQEAEANDPGTMFFLTRVGIGRMRFGKASYSYDSNSRIERFKTTMFWVLFWFPLVPVGTYWVERKRKFFSKKFLSWERLPLDWTQVLRVWIGAAALIFLVALAVRLLTRAI